MGFIENVLSSILQSLDAVDQVLSEAPVLSISMRAVIDLNDGSVRLNFDRGDLDSFDAFDADSESESIDMAGMRKRGKKKAGLNTAKGNRIMRRKKSSQATHSIQAYASDSNHESDDEDDNDDRIDENIAQLEPPERPKRLYDTDRTHERFPRHGLKRGRPRRRNPAECPTDCTCSSSDSCSEPEWFALARAHADRDEMLARRAVREHARNLAIEEYLEAVEDNDSFRRSSPSRRSDGYSGDSDDGDSVGSDGHVYDSGDSETITSDDERPGRSGELRFGLTRLFTGLRVGR